MREETNKIEKIKKVSHVAMIFTRISKILGIVSLIIALVCGMSCIVISLQVDDEINQKIEQHMDDSGFYTESIMSIEIFGIEMDLTEMGIMDTENMEWGMLMGIYCLFIAIPVFLLVITLHFVEKVFHEIWYSDSPFRPQLLKNLIAPFVLLTVMTASNSLFFGAVVGISFWCVYCILDYGCELQKMSDETLYIHQEKARRNYGYYIKTR